MYDVDVKSVCKQIRRDRHPKPCRRHYLGKHNGNKVFILEAALKNPYYDYSVGFEDIVKPFKPRSPRGLRNQPWYPKSFVGELLWWLFKSCLEVMAGERN